MQCPLCRVAVRGRPRSEGEKRPNEKPAVCVQGHIDMVTEADGDFDFERTPLSVVREGDWVTAEGTTLGADNGIGVAAALALLDSAADAPLPPLEALFTVDEETGLTGAFGLDAKALGITAKKMLNLDTEEWGSLYVGCAGGGVFSLATTGAEPMSPPLGLKVTPVKWYSLT